jgi:NAD(P)-dependent dehydrogenase (short-subunit alcohol dehydrogenase family)/predicted ester cyclase
MPVALITGTSTGIGLATARLFAQRGYDVYAGARSPSRSEGLAQAIADGLSIIPVPLDVDGDDSVSAAMATIGEVDVLVNNAGLGSAAPVEHMPLAETRQLFETNFFGAVRMMQAVLPSMRTRRRGTVINVTSAMGRITLPGHGSYAATKFALGAISESLAMEVRPFGIRVGIVEPGVILTPIWGKRDIALPDGHAYDAVMGRLMRIFAPQFEGGTPPDVVAEAIWGAVTRPDTPVHLVVGPDAECLVAARQRLTPDEWVAVMSEPDDDRFVAKLTEACGHDIFSSPSLYARRQRLEAFARDYTAAWCSQDATRVASFFEDDGSLTINDGPPAVGHPAITADAQGFMTAFPDLMVALDRLEFDRDVVRYHWTLTGTNSGPGGTGQQVRISGHETWTFGSLGRIARSQGAFDAADYQQQLGGA